MKTYTGMDLKQALRDVGIVETDCVFMHSSLLALGRFLSQTHGPQREITEVLIDSLRDGSLLAPTFTFSFCAGKPFNRQESVSEGMGMLSEHIRRLPQSLRSKHPIQSVSGIGKDVPEIITPDTKSAYSPNGSFGLLLQKNTKLLLLGASINHVSMIHYVEEKMRVPYRYWKTFIGQYIDLGVSTTRQYDMYVRDMEEDPTIRQDLIKYELKARRLFCSTSLGSGTIAAFPLTAYDEIASEIIRNNPRGLIA